MTVKELKIYIENIQRNCKKISKLRTTLISGGVEGVLSNNEIQETKEILEEMAGLDKNIDEILEEVERNLAEEVARLQELMDNTVVLDMKKFGLGRTNSEERENDERE